MFAEAVLEDLEPDSTHGSKAASGGYLVKRVTQGDHRGLRPRWSLEEDCSAGSGPWRLLRRDRARQACGS